MKSSPSLLEGPIAGRMLFFALPLAASCILQQLFNAADVAVVGRFVGSDALAAVGATAQIVNLVVNLFIGLSLGANILLSTLIGERKPERIARAVHASLLLSVVCGVFLGIFGAVLARPALRLIATPEDILPASELYLRIYFAGMPFVMLVNFATAILRSKGDTRRPFLVMLFSGALNLGLNLLLVLVFHRGVDGVALATVASNGVSAGLLLRLLSREDAPFRFRFRDLRPDADLIRRVVALGLPAGLQSVMFSLSNVLIQSALNSLGAATIAGTSAALNFEYFSFYVLNAFAQASVTFTGQNFGARNLPRCRRVLFWALGLGVALTELLAGLFLFFAPFFAGLFTEDAAVIALATERMFLVLPYEFLNASIEIFAGTLRSLGRAKLPTAICAFGVCFVRVLWVLWGFGARPTFAMLLHAYPLSWLITTAAMALAVFLRFRTASRELAA